MTEQIAVIGLGYVGLPVALAFARKFKTVGFDVDVTKVNDGKRRSVEGEAQEARGPLPRMGRETRQGEIGLVIADHYYAIRDCKEPKS